MNNNNRIMKKLSHCLFAVIVSFGSTAVYSLDNSSNDRALFDQAVLMSSDGEWSAAEKIFRDVALRNPGWPEPKNNLAIALYNTGKLEQARQALDEAVSSLQSFKVAQANRQRLYDYSATIAYYKVVGIPEKPELPKLELLTNIQSSSNAGVQQQAAAPVVTKAPVISSRSDDLSVIEQQVNNSVLNWTKAWSSANVKGYLSVYSSSFKPSEYGKTYTQWRTDRTNKLKFGKISKVNVDSVKVYVDSTKNQAIAQFVQHYRSSTYKDKVLKQLQLTLQDGRWLINSERVLQQLY